MLLWVDREAQLAGVFTAGCCAGPSSRGFADSSGAGAAATPRTAGAGVDAALLGCLLPRQVAAHAL